MTTHTHTPHHDASLPTHSPLHIPTHVCPPCTHSSPHTLPHIHIPFLHSNTYPHSFLFTHSYTHTLPFWSNLRKKNFSAFSFRVNQEKKSASQLLWVFNLSLSVPHLPLPQHTSLYLFLSQSEEKTFLMTGENWFPHCLPGQKLFFSQFQRSTARPAPENLSHI